MKYIYLGKIVGTHGIKGELRMLSDFKYKNKVLKKNFKIYIGSEKIEETIVSYRYHKIFDMIVLNNYYNINDVLKYKGYNVFINKEDLILNENEFLNEDLIGLSVYISDKCIGTIKKIEKFPKETLVVENEKKHYLIPYVSDIIKSINLNERKIIVKDIKGLVE